MSFLTAVDKFLSDSRGSEMQIREAKEAAQAVDNIPMEAMREKLQRTFWAWLQKGHWQKPMRSVDFHLESTSRLDQKCIQENYRGMYPRYDYNRASELAVKAWDTRVNRCAEEIKAGQPLEDCLTFVYCRAEWKEALDKARRAAA
jgi:hypothetical protein